MFSVQLILISKQIEVKYLDQYYIGIYAIGLATIPLTNIIQTFYSKTLVKESEFKESERQNIYLDCLTSFIFSNLFLTMLFEYMGLLSIKNIYIILIFSMISAITVLGSQYNLYKKKYLLSQLSPLIFGILILFISIFEKNISLSFVLIYSVTAFGIVLLIYSKKNLSGFLKNIYLINWFRLSFNSYFKSLLRYLSVILMIGPVFYIIVISTVLSNNFIGYASYYGFFYSLIGFLSVLLGQNMLSVLLAEKTFDSYIISTKPSKVFFNSMSFIVIMVIIFEVFRVLISQSYLFIDYTPVQLRYLEFLLTFFYGIVSCIVLFIIWNILRGYFISNNKSITLVFGSSAGLICVLVMSYYAVVKNNSGILIYAIPFALFINILILIFDLIFNRTSQSEKIKKEY